MWMLLIAHPKNSSTHTDPHGLVCSLGLPVLRLSILAAFVAYMLPLDVTATSTCSDACNELMAQHGCT